jgi:hypothetical protein
MGRRQRDGNSRNIVFAGESCELWRSANILTDTRDAFTTSGDFIISPHTGAKGLYVATCGNFHGWKFFPVLGKYVIEMLEGTLSPDLMQKWSWDREWPDPCMFPDYPRYEMKDLLDPAVKL